MAKIEGFTARVELGGVCGKDRRFYSKGVVGRALTKIEGLTARMELGGLFGKDRGLYSKDGVGRALWQR